METMISQEALAAFLATSFIGAFLSFVGTTKRFWTVKSKNIQEVFSASFWIFWLAIFFYWIFTY